MVVDVNLKEWAAATGVSYVTARRQYAVCPAAGTTPASGPPTIAVDRVVTEVGCALNGHRTKFLALLRDPAVSTIVVKHRDRFARFGAEYVEAALAGQGGELLVVDPAEVDDDLVRDVTEILTSLCARPYGRRGAAKRARRAVEAATGDAG